MFKIKYEMLFDSGVEKVFWVDCEENIDEDSIVEGINNMNAAIKNLYQEDNKSCFNIDGQLIAFHKTSAIKISYIKV